MTKFYDKLKTVFRGGVKCHEHSDALWWGLDCKDLVDKLGPDYENFMFKYYYYNATQGFLNTPYGMNNTDCVKNQVTDLLFFDSKNPVPTFGYQGLSLIALTSLLVLNI